MRRLRAVNFPLSLAISQTTVTANAEGTGWQSSQEQVTVGGFFLGQAILYLNDPSPAGGVVVILREQLRELAEYLDRGTDLGTRQSRFLPDSTGTEAITARYLSPLATHYLKSLPDLAIRNEKLVDELTTELEELIAGDRTTRTWQLAVAGIKPVETYTHKDVELRPLTPGERGAFLELRPQPRTFRPVPYSDLVVPYSISQVIPSALISIQTTRPMGEQDYESSLTNRVALAFFLAGYDLTGTSFLVAIDHPQWIAGNGYFPASPIGGKLSTADQPITAEQFEVVIALAYKMPDFSMREASGHEVVLSRMLRACGMDWRDSAFLDFTIALEAALLKGFDRELRYRFALYGALFLRAEFDPVKTFARLKKVYDIRSALVHGGKLASNELQYSTQEAAELAKAVTRKAIESGWPDPKNLDATVFESLREGDDRE